MIGWAVAGALGLAAGQGGCHEPDPCHSGACGCRGGDFCDLVCDVLSSLGDKESTRLIAKDLADEIAGLCTGSGPWAQFLNGATNVDLSRGSR